MTTTNRVIENACGLPTVLRVAQAANLPTPLEMTIYPDHVGIDLATADDLAQWAEWIDAEVDVVAQIGPVVHQIASGDKFDLPLHLSHIGSPAVSA